MNNKIKNILITNIVSLNTGDAAILQGTLIILRQKYGDDVRVTVFDRSAAAAEKYYPWASFRQGLFSSYRTGWLASMLMVRGYGHWVKRARYARLLLALRLMQSGLAFIASLFVNKTDLSSLKEYLQADLILSTGGTYLIENYDLGSSIYDLKLSLATGRKTGFFTQTLGPFNNPGNRKSFKELFARSSVILLRDERSRSHIVELGLDGNNIHLAADAAFALKKASMEKPSNNMVSSAPMRVAISVRSMRYFHSDKSEAYFAAMVHAVRIAVVDFGAQVTFLSTCQGIPEYWTNDAETAEEIYKALPRDIQASVEVDHAFRQPLELVDVYQSFDAVIATRMHAAILAVCAGVPTLGVAYEFKLEELYKNMDIEDLVISLDSLTEAEMEKSVRRLLGGLEHYQSSVAEAAQKMQAAALNVKAFLP